MSSDPRSSEVSLGTRVAFFGSTTLLAREIRTVMASRAFLPADVKLYDAAGEGAVSEFAGEPLLVTKPDEESIFDLEVAFMCGAMAETEPYLDWAPRRGFVAIDLSGASRTRAGVPLVHTEINPGDIASGPGGAAGRRPAPVIAAPHSVSHNVASLAAAARGAGRIRDIEALALRPVSEMGDPGIDELYRQTVAILNFSSMPQDVFGRQIAFNVVPSSGIDRSRAEGFEERVQAETARMLGMRPAEISLSSAFVPTFHGHSLAVTLSFERAPGLEAVRESIRAARGVRLIEDPAACSPVELAGEESVAVIGLRDDPHRPERVSLWSVCDNLKGGAALNAIRIAERVVDLLHEERS